MLLERRDLEETAPGNILQRLHLSRRIRKLQAERPGRVFGFVDVGAGKGHWSNMFLQLGYSGMGIDLHPESCARNHALNRDFVSSGRYVIINGNFLSHDFGDERFDIVFSCNVIGHLSPEHVDAYFAKARRLLREDGVIITIEQASMKHWGVEDEIVGHFKRYSFACFHEISKQHELEMRHMSGLTYPLSNWLLPLSNALNVRADRNKLELPHQTRVELSGNRHVRYKNIFPWYFRLFLNDFTMQPFDWLQQLFSNNPSCMVIYSELVQAGSLGPNRTDRNRIQSP